MLFRSSCLTGGRVGALGEEVLDPIVNDGLQEGGAAAHIKSIGSAAIVVGGERAGILSIAGSLLRSGYLGVDLHLEAHGGIRSLDRAGAGGGSTGYHLAAEILAGIGGNAVLDQGKIGTSVTAVGTIRAVEVVHRLKHSNVEHVAATALQIDHATNAGSGLVTGRILVIRDPQGLLAVGVVNCVRHRLEGLGYHIIKAGGGVVAVELGVILAQIFLAEVETFQPVPLSSGQAALDRRNDVVHIRADIKRGRRRGDHTRQAKPDFRRRTGGKNHLGQLEASFNKLRIARTRRLTDELIEIITDIRTRGSGVVLGDVVARNDIAVDPVGGEDLAATLGKVVEPHSCQDHIIGRATVYDLLHVTALICPIPLIVGTSIQKQKLLSHG